MLALYLRIRNLFVNEEGQDLIEYALLVFLLVIAAVAMLGTVGGNINQVFSNISGWLTGATTGS